MTREEAIERLKQNKAAAEFHAGMVQNTNTFENELKDIEAIDMAIESLSAEAVQEAVPTVVRVTMSDGNQYYLEHERDECDHCVYKWGTKGGDTE